MCINIDRVINQLISPLNTTLYNYYITLHKSISKCANMIFIHVLSSLYKVWCIYKYSHSHNSELSIVYLCYTIPLNCLPTFHHRVCQPHGPLRLAEDPLSLAFNMPQMPYNWKSLTLCSTCPVFCSNLQHVKHGREGKVTQTTGYILYSLYTQNGHMILQGMKIHLSTLNSCY